MSTLMTALRTSVTQQHQHSALTNCIQGWDGAVTAETVIGGIQDRYAAMGLKAPAIRLQRVDINTVAIETRRKVIGYFVRSRECNVPDAMFEHAHLITLKDHTKIWYWFDKQNFFNREEITMMASFLIEEFHHG